jgi:hypothetical protein
MKFNNLDINEGTKDAESILTLQLLPPVREALVQQTLESAKLRLISMHQTIPNRGREGRIKPRVNWYLVSSYEKPYCAYCLKDIDRNCFNFHQCCHLMHAECLLKNILDNGIDPIKREMFCPICYRRLVTDTYT